MKEKDIVILQEGFTPVSTLQNEQRGFRPQTTKVPPKVPPVEKSNK